MFPKGKSIIVVVATSLHLERMVKLMKNFMPNFSKKGIKAKLYSSYNKPVLKKLQNVDHFEYSPQTSFVTVDGKEMVFMVSNESVAPDYEVAIWISSPFFVSAVNILFEQSLK